MSMKAQVACSSSANRAKPL